tara:strand:+ start:9968 stop:10159 length:192 start_codon:yes stop_codon:yes gene_type:complete
MKNIIRKILGITTKKRTVNKKNKMLPFGRMSLIHAWEKPVNDDITIRSNFNRELYYKYLNHTK